METERKEYVKQEHDKVNLLVDTFTLFDDELMGRVFDKNVFWQQNLYLGLYLAEISRSQV